jgi:phosphoribosylformylglycinamidine synthase
LFGEDQGRYLVTVSDHGRLEDACAEAGVTLHMIGRTGGASVAGPHWSVSLADLRHAHESFFPRLMGPDAALA